MLSFPLTSGTVFKLSLFFFKGLCTQRVLSRLADALHSAWSSLGGSSILFVMWWLLWNFRNKKIFEDKAPDKAMFFDDVICKSDYWCRYRSKKVFSWDDWFKNSHLISL
ncbi:hypothetical protein Tco_1160348 [Tanacetum coccineum]